MIDAITFDAQHAASLARFWCVVLEEYEIAPYSEQDIADLAAKGITDVEDDPNVMCVSKTGGVRLFFQTVPEGRTAKSRTHLDVRVGRETFDRMLELGATIVQPWDGGYWMNDPQGNDFCAILEQ